MTTVKPRSTTAVANCSTSGVMPGISCTTTTPGPVPRRYVSCVVPPAVWLPRVPAGEPARFAHAAIVHHRPAVEAADQRN